MSAAPPKVLIIAGSDSSGGAGIQADIKTVTALGGYAATAITALTAQNTEEVRGILAIEPEFVKAQIEAVLDDIGADAIKIGMLANAGIIAAVAETLPEGVPVVLDPVMVATSGASLLDPEAVEALKTRLIPKATILTPNIAEAEQLTGLTIKSKDDMVAAGQVLLGLGAGAVLVKGGHGGGDEILDLLVTGKGMFYFPHRRIKTRHSHGTGCTLASAMALGLASGLDVKKAVDMAIDYVLKALACAPGFGRGNGPLGHTLGSTLYTKK